MDKEEDKIHTQEDAVAPSPIDDVEARVEAEMKRIEGSARERVAHALQDQIFEGEIGEHERAINEYAATINRMIAEMWRVNEKIEREQGESERLKAETRGILSRLKAA